MLLVKNLLSMDYACCNVSHFVYQLQSAYPRVATKVRSLSQIHVVMAEYMETQNIRVTE